MNEQTIEKLKEVLAPLAEKLGQGAGFAWETIMRQMYIHAFRGILTALLGFAILAAIPIVWKIAAREIEKNPHSDWAFGRVHLFVVGGIVALLLIVSGAYAAVGRFINPEFYAIDYLIHLGSK